jgi:hypothetical protein
MKMRFINASTEPDKLISTGTYIKGVDLVLRIDILKRRELNRAPSNKLAMLQKWYFSAFVTNAIAAVSRLLGSQDRIPFVKVHP